MLARRTLKIEENNCQEMFSCIEPEIKTLDSKKFRLLLFCHAVRRCYTSSQMTTAMAGHFSTK